MLVVAVGNAFDGIALFGLFETGEDAAAWAGRAYPCDEWNIVSITMLGPTIFFKEDEA